MLLEFRAGVSPVIVTVEPSVGCWGSPVMLVKGQWELALTGSPEAGPTKEQLRIINGAGCQVINTVCRRQDSVRFIHCGSHRLERMYNSHILDVYIWQKHLTKTINTKIYIVYILWFTSTKEAVLRIIIQQKKQKKKRLFFLKIRIDWSSNSRLTHHKNNNNIKIIQQLWLDANTVRATN